MAGKRKPNKPKPTIFPEISNLKQRKFLECYARLGGIRLAAEAAEVAERSHRNWKNLDGPDGELYRKAFEEARDMSGQALVDEARRRAILGSDTLLIFLIKGHYPEIYRERADIRHSGGDEITKPLAEIVKECIEFLDAGPTTCPEPAEGAKPESTNGDGHGNAGNGDLRQKD